MLTQREIETYQQTGLIPPERLHALIHALRARSEDVRVKSRVFRDRGESHFGAAMSGRALAYKEAAVLVQQILDGYPMRPRKDSSTKARSRAWRLSRKSAALPLDAPFALLESDV